MRPNHHTCAQSNGRKEGQGELQSPPEPKSNHHNGHERHYGRDALDGVSAALILKLEG